MEIFKEFEIENQGVVSGGGMTIVILDPGIDRTIILES